MKKNVISNLSLEDYKKKYHIRREYLPVISKKEVEAFDKNHKEGIREKNYLLKNNKWALINDKYYQIPRAPRYTWFRNLKSGIQIGTCVLCAGVVAGSITLGAVFVASNRANTDDCMYVDKLNSEIDVNSIRTTHDFVSKYGDISKLQLKDSKDELAFNVKTKQIVIVNKRNDQILYAKQGVEHKSDVFRFKDTYTFATNPSNDTYSVYLTDKYTGGNNIVFNSGLDVGNHLGMTLNYKKSSNVNYDTHEDSNEAYIPMIVTNYGDLIVDGKLNSISHYGVLNSLSIKSFDGEYNEYGTVADKIVIKSGKFNAKDEAVINTVYVDGSSVKITIDEKIESFGTICFTKDDYKQTTIKYIGKVTEDKKPEVKKDEIIPAPTEDTILNGFGTLKSPYTFKDMIKAAPKITEKYDKYSYFVYTGSQKEIDGSSWAYNGKEMYLNGQLDCKGLTINNLDSFFIRTLGKKDDFTNVHSVSNLTLNCNISSSNPECAVARSVGMKAELNNITVHGVIAGSGAAAFCAFGANNVQDTEVAMDLTFNNCYSDATLISTDPTWSIVGCFVMKSYCNQNDSLITINDSIFLGNVFYPASEDPEKYVSYFAVDNRACVWMKTTYSEEFIAKYGNPEGTLYPIPNKEPGTGRFQAYKFTSYTSEYNCKDTFLRTDALNQIVYLASSKNQAVSSQTLEKLEVKKVTDASYATATLYIAPNDHNGKGAYIQPFETEDAIEIDKGGTKYYSTENIKNFYICVNKDSSQVQEFEYNVDDGGVFYHRPGDQGDPYKKDWAYVTITQFNENKLPIQINHITLTLD